MASRVRLLVGGLSFTVLAVMLSVSVCQSGAEAQQPAASDQTAAADNKFPAPLSKLALEDGDTLVFLGDSITHQCLYTQYVEDFFYTRFPQKRIRFHNSGVGGAKAWDALQRFDRDVADYQPKYVTVLLGMNDGAYQPFQQEIFDTYQRDVNEVIKRIKEAGATPVLMTPTMHDARAARLGNSKRDENSLALYNSVLAYYGQWLREVATQNGYGFADLYSPLNNLTLEARKTDPKFTMIRDAIHPDAPGQLVMAYALIEDLGLRGPVSSVRLVNGSNGKPRAQAQGGSVENLKVTGQGAEFTFTATSLPWILPDEAQLGAKLLKLGHRASREALEVHDLPAGQYELTIDGQAVGTYSTTQLARHVELQDNPKTPQYQQALKVAELNKQRNSGPVRSLRNEWRTFQIHARLAEALKQTPGNAGLEKQVANLAKNLEGIEDRIRQHEADAKKIEDQIFTVNQPKPRHYVLKRMQPEAAAGRAAAAVSGTVTLDGKPLAKATVTFYSQAAAAMKSKAGVTDDNGHFALHTKPGQYSLTVEKKLRPEDNKGQPQELLPPKYSDPEQSALTVEVKAGANQFNLSLTSR